MGIYSQIIFPRLLDWTMSGEPMSAYRRELLKQATGRVLEIGFGTGLNLPYYPPAVKSLTVVDPNPGMNAIAAQRVQTSPIPVEIKQLSGEALPFASGSFDSVVSTWTLCSIPQAEQALQQIHRVLKPGGCFLFVEHGLSPESEISVWQDRLTPIQKRIADGCHLNRPMQALVEQVFEQVTVETAYATGLPKMVGYFYWGRAEKEL
ncbi:MAG: class I SAM-dependent methyltransferase [Leptolyngbya sp. SIO4C1]|nr:class I SAM-dependent methyltransferase [Leptolyngbya sp. SIO4C1]